MKTLCAVFIVFITSGTHAWGQMATQLEYSFTSDYASERSPRLYRHDISLSPSYTVSDWTFFGQGGGYARTLDQSVYVDQSTTSSGLVLNDLVLGTAYSFPEVYFLGHKQNVSASLSNTFIISEAGRSEGYRGIPSAGFKLSSPFFNERYQLVQKISASYVSNIYEYSPVSGSYPPNYYFSYSLMNVFNLYTGLSLSVGVGTKRTYYTDGFYDDAFEQRAALSYSYKNFGIYAYYSNGDFTENDKVELWYVNRFRTLVSIGLSYSF